MSKPFSLHLGLASLRVFNPDWQNGQDVDLALTRKPHVLGLGEVGPGQRQVVADAANAHGYIARHLWTGRSDFTFLMRAAAVQVVKAGTEYAHRGKPGPASEGGYAARSVDWVELQVGGEHVFVHGVHWVVPKTARRERDHLATTRVMIDQVQEHAPGRALSFWMGDINVRDDPRDVDELTVPLVRAGLVSVWDELGVYPSTHGRPGPIDVIGSYHPDRRVSAQSVTVHRRGVHSDHHQVNAAYTIDRN